MKKNKENRTAVERRENTAQESILDTQLGILVDWWYNKGIHPMAIFSSNKLFELGAQVDNEEKQPYKANFLGLMARLLVTKLDGDYVYELVAESEIHSYVRTVYSALKENEQDLFLLFVYSTCEQLRIDGLKESIGKALSK